MPQHPPRAVHMTGHIPADVQRHLGRRGQAVMWKKARDCLDAVQRQFIIPGKLLQRRPRQIPMRRLNSIRRRHDLHTIILLRAFLHITVAQSDVPESFAPKRQTISSRKILQWHRPLAKRISQDRKRAGTEPPRARWKSPSEFSRSGLTSTSSVESRDDYLRPQERPASGPAI